MKILNYLDGIARASPIIIYIYTFLNASLFGSKKYLFWGLILFGSDCFNHIIKEYVFRPLMGSKKIPILGYGLRPYTKNCGLFRTGKYSTSYGMPSGHSQIVCLFATFSILEILNTKNRSDMNKMISITVFVLSAILVMFSRVYWAKCHTIQQVLFGGCIGIGLGFFFHSKLIKY